MDSIILQTQESAVTDGDVLGRLGFAASSETGTNARLVVAKIEAVAEETFDASNNATEMVFYLAADGAAASKMTLTSAGNLNIGGELQTTNIGYTDGDNAIVIADGGGCTFPQDATFSGSIQVATIDYTDGDNAITIADGGKVTFTKAHVGARVDKGNQNTGTVSLDASTSNYFEINMQGDFQLDITNAVLGQRIIVRINQDDSGGGTSPFTLTYADTIKWAGGSAPTLTADKADVLGFLCTTASSAFDGFVIGQNI
mgnify:CR=1 FL=1|tara:strand:- start:9 stop:779 length:771 start_codon:yes stop_codon:yes gene_type:complete